MTRILFHLGMPKTGTTLLQGTMARAVASLRAEGVLYPRAGRIGSAHHPVTTILREKGPAERAAFLAELAAEIASARTEAPAPRIALVSSEGMVNLCGTDFAADFAGFLSNPGEGLQGTAVIFLREMTSLLESMFFQTTRFRSIDNSFDEYLAPRPKWMESFLAGLKIIKARMGEAFEIVPAAKGYDVLRAFEARLGLPDRFLDEPSRTVPSTVRPSLKSQIALVHLDWLESEVGFKINRRVFSRHLSEGRVFADDVSQFTIYAPGQRDQIAGIGIKIMEEAGFHDYAALTRALTPSSLPHHVIDRSELSGADIAAVAALRRSIEEGPKTDRADRLVARRAALKPRAQPPEQPPDQAGERMTPAPDEPPAPRVAGDEGPKGDRATRQALRRAERQAKREEDRRARKSREPQR